MFWRDLIGIYKIYNLWIKFNIFYCVYCFRPDDWVMFDVKNKKQLPEYPTLQQDDAQHMTKELPRPILFNHHFHKKSSTNINKITGNWNF